jgi:argininosuccinate lyase
MEKPWSGRFTEKTASIVDSFTESISFDYRLWKYDIIGSIAHVKMLARQKIINKNIANKIIKGLKEISEEIKSNRFIFKKELEDIHMNIESALIDKIGEIGGMLHTARSRNDQVALDMRLYLRDETKEIISLLKKLQTNFINLAVKHTKTIIPGYTHMQHAQPVLLSHHLLSYVEMLQRDVERLFDSLKRTNRLPLGACALAGTSLPIDRSYVAKILQFESVLQNSIDAISDRDFIIEFLSDCAILIMHLSRLSEELILWCTTEFNFAELPDAFATGSSIMPQKKNPDILELIRAKTGRVYANLVNLLTIMKGLPLSYNRDLQEDKPPLFDTIDTTKSCLKILIELLPKIRFNIDIMRQSASMGFTTATDLAEYLVKKGIPFRNAHKITGKIIAYCINNNKNIESLSIEEFKKFSDFFSNDIYNYLSPENSIKNKISEGSTSEKEILKNIKRLKQIIKYEK